MRIISEEKAIQRFLELDKLFKAGELEEGTRSWKERRELYWHSYQIPGYENMRPVLAHCEACSACAYHTLDQDQPVFIKGGHTGWGEIGVKGTTQKHFSFCSEKCWNKHEQKEQKKWDALMNRDFSDFPEEMDLPTFENFTLWVAKHTIDMQDHEELKSYHPLFVLPEYLAQEFRSILVGQLPSIKLLGRSDRLSLPAHGTYTLQEPYFISKNQVCKILGITMVEA